MTTYYRAGQSSPCNRLTLDPVQVPVVEYGILADAKNRTVVGTFEWTGSVAGVCDGAGDASALPPLDLRIGVTEAGAPTAIVDGPPSGLDA